MSDATPTPVKPDRACLLDAIRANPADDTVRVAFADWLEQDAQDNPTRVACGRCDASGRLLRNPGPDGHWVACSHCHGTGTVIDGSREARAEFIRVQCEIESLRCPECRGGHCVAMWAPGKVCVTHEKRLGYLRDRERELLAAHPEWVTLPCGAKGRHHGDTCNGGRVQCANAQFTEDCSLCHGTGDLLKCHRCQGTGKAYGTDRVFNTPDGSGLKCPACTGTGHRVTWERGFACVRCTSAEVWTVTACGYCRATASSPPSRRCYYCAASRSDVSSTIRTVPTAWAKAVCESEWVIGLTLTDREPYHNGGGYAFYAVGRERTTIGIIPESADLPDPVFSAMGGHDRGGGIRWKAYATADAARTALAWAACRWVRGHAGG